MLVNAANDQDIRLLSDDDTLILDQYDPPQFNIRAEVGPGVGSVVFAYQDNDRYRVESTAPFAFAGNSGSDYNAWTPEIGANRLAATPYSEKRGEGMAGPPIDIRLEVLPTAPSPPDTLLPVDTNRVLVFYKTNGFRHASIQDGIALIEELGLKDGAWLTEATDDASVFTNEQLARYQVVVWCNTSGNGLLTPDQQAAFEVYIRSGGGFVGIHAATDTYRDGSWPWYNELVGAIVQRGPNHTSPNTNAIMDVVSDHPAVAHLGESWEKVEEYYYWELNGGYLNPDNIDMLRVRSTGDQSYDAPRPIAWYKEYDGGRAFYTALGHHGRDYREDEAFIMHIEEGIKWAGSFSERPVQSVVKRINCGGKEVRFGDITFEADQYFNEDSRRFQNSNVTEIAGTELDEIYLTERTSKADLQPISYSIPVDSGAYNVLLHFAEIYFQDPDKRIFSVALEGEPVLVDLDITAEAGSQTALIKTISATVADGELTLDFTPDLNRPKVSAIEVFRLNEPGLPPTLDCTWEELAASTMKKVESQSAAISGKLYVFSGFTNGLDVIETTEIYDPATDNWSMGAPIPIPMTHMGIAVVDEEAWLIGGFAGDHPGKAIAEVQIYDPASDSWRYGPPLPAPRASGGAAYLDGKVHYFGGLLPDRKTDTGEHYMFDLDQPELGWTMAAPLPSPRNHLGAASVGGKIYAIGGQYGHDAPPRPVDTSLVHAYDPATDTWEARAKLPNVRSHFEPGTTVYQNRILIVGGRGPEARETLMQYDPATDAWSELCRLPASLQAPNAKVIGDQLIVANGGLVNVGDPQTAAWRLLLQPQAPLASPFSALPPPSAVERPAITSVTAFPNPARDELTIRFEQPAGATELVLFDANGRILYQQRQQFLSPGTGEFRLNTTGWPEGLYIYRLRLGKATYHDKVLIAR